MTHPELDMPFWSALRSIHAHLAVAADDVARYPAEYAPFLGVARDGACVDATAILEGKHLLARRRVCLAPLAEGRHQLLTFVALNEAL